MSMKKHLYKIVGCFFIIFNHAAAQNLVINPSLENYITCPGFGQFSNTYINNWNKPTYGSTDYYHNNCPGIQPISQTPHSGDAYFGIIAYNYGTEYREYATGELSTSLIAGVQYTVSFYVSLNDGYIQAINEMGAYLSTTPLGPYPNSLHIPVMPQIQNNNLLSSTSSWMLVSGTFIASGGEQYITIGNFNDDVNTTITMVGNTGSFGAYYFVDDVSVSVEPNGIPNLTKNQNLIYPNPSEGVFTVQLGEEAGQNLIAEITDCSGRLILSETFSVNKNPFNQEFNLSFCENGIYFLRMKSENSLIIYEIIKW
jgi:OOP family OmpA-OmpF porin